ncbi:MAG: archaeosortase/exosortase family protein, partial [Myxococcota bacterium]
MIAALAVVWVLAHAPVLRWAAWTWTEQAHSRENWVLVGAGALYVATRAPWRAPLLAWGPAALIVACAAAGRLLAATWQVHVLEAALFVLGAWGIAGLCLDRGAWRAGWPAALATVVLLPFDGALDTFLGFPLRLATAKAVAAALGTGSADTLIRFENHVAQVDVPCSGVGGLWTGTVLLLVAAAVEGRRLGARFVALWVATLGALVVANFARVLALAMLLPWPTVATVLHVPLGVLTFGVVVGIAVVGLRF